MAGSKYAPSMDSSFSFRGPGSEIKNGLLRTWSADAMTYMGRGRKHGDYDITRL
jgi:hypothetical protein